MSREYAEEKIREALKLNGGDLMRSRQQVMSWAASDSRLMSALAAPHLDGIVAYQVERVASGRAELEKRHPEVKKAPDEGGVFGMDLLRAVAASEATVFGHDGAGAPPKRRYASKQHIDAIHKMAGKGRPNKKS